MAGRSHPALEARDSNRKDRPRARGQGRRRGEATRGVVAVPAQEGLKEPSHIEGQEGWQEEIPLIQGKEQQLCFAGAAVKRYPTPKVRETQVR